MMRAVAGSHDMACIIASAETCGVGREPSICVVTKSGKTALLKEMRSTPANFGFPLSHDDRARFSPVPCWFVSNMVHAFSAS